MATGKQTFKFTEFLEETKLSLESDLKLKGALAAIFGGLASGRMKKVPKRTTPSQGGLINQSAPIMGLPTAVF